jgi:hypothetical protein
MKFITKSWHPNISSDSGAICLDILKTEWSPALTIRTALISLQALLSAAEPDDPQDAVVAKQYKEHHQEFMKTAKFWTETYAGAQAGGACHGPTRTRSHALARARTLLLRDRARLRTHAPFIVCLFSVHMMGMVKYMCLLWTCRASMNECMRGLACVLLSRADSEKLEQLMSMGFEKAKCVAALSKAKGDVNAATEALLSDM